MPGRDFLGAAHNVINPRRTARGTASVRLAALANRQGHLGQRAGTKNAQNRSGADAMADQKIQLGSQPQTIVVTDSNFEPSLQVRCSCLLCSGKNFRPRVRQLLTGL